MTTYHFTACYGDIIKEGQITQVNAAGLTYHVYIDGYYQGNISLVRGQYVFFSNTNPFTSEEIDILIGWVEGMK